MDSLPDNEPRYSEHFGSLMAILGERAATCPKHGDFVSQGRRVLRREMWTSCPSCAAEEKQAQEEEHKRELEASRIRKLKEAIGESLIPARFQGRSFENYQAETPEQKRALAICRDYAENLQSHIKAGTGLVLAGLPGTGKSHLASSILLKGVEDGLMCRYVTCMSLIRSVRDTWRRDSERSERQIMHLVGEQIDLLAIDEIGVQYGTDGEQTILFDVLDRRYSGMRPTILMTNQDKAGFKSFVGDRVFDRLVETSRWVPFDWASYRPQARVSA